MPGIEASPFGIGIFMFLSIGIATLFCLGFATSRFGIGIFMPLSTDVVLLTGIFMPSLECLWSCALMSIVVPSGITIVPLEEPSVLP